MLRLKDMLRSPQDLLAQCLEIPLTDNWKVNLKEAHSNIRQKILPNSLKIWAHLAPS
jgi:hypothetical protein